jgi:hypothetical protein
MEAPTSSRLESSAHGKTTLQGESGVHAAHAEGAPVCRCDRGEDPCPRCLKRGIRSVVALTVVAASREGAEE